MPEEPIKYQPIQRKDSRSVQQARYTPARIRWIIVNWTMLFIVLTIVAYCYTKDIRVLLSGTMMHTMSGFIFAYYFRRQRGKK